MTKHIKTSWAIVSWLDQIPCRKFHPQPTPSAVWDTDSFQIGFSFYKIYRRIGEVGSMFSSKYVEACNVSIMQDIVYTLRFLNHLVGGPQMDGTVCSCLFPVSQKSVNLSLRLEPIASVAHLGMLKPFPRCLCTSYLRELTRSIN